MFIGELNYKPILDHSRKNKYVMGWGGIKQQLNPRVGMINKPSVLSAQYIWLQIRVRIRKVGGSTVPWPAPPKEREKKKENGISLYPCVRYGANQLNQR